MTIEFRRIIVPIDGSVASKKAAKKAIYLAKHLSVDITAIHVIDPTRSMLAPELMSSIDKMMSEQAHSYLHEIEKIGKRNGVTIATKIVRGVPFMKIISEAKRNDLIVMGHKGRTALDKILLGSVSEKVVRHALCPVMIVREPKEETL